MSPHQLAGQIRTFVQNTCAESIDRYFPTLRIPRTFIGHQISTDFAVDLCATLACLHTACLTTIANRPLADTIRTLLLQIDGPKTDTFYSYRIAETLLAFGGMNPANPLLSNLTAAQTENLIQAVDSSHIYNERGQPLGGRPNNYWGVLARCEFRRQQLGLLADDTILTDSLNRVRTILFANPLGFFDDSRTLTGRFDIYSPDVQLFLEPLWPFFDPEKVRHNLRAHTQLLQTIALENGAFIAWGRSIGLLSILLTAEFGAVALRDNLTDDPAYMLTLVAHAFTQTQSWFDGALVNAHRHRMTDGYRGPHRLLQMTFDSLLKLAYTAEVLTAYAERTNNPPDINPTPHFFPQDIWIDLGTSAENQRQAGLWMFRNNIFAFQLPIVDAASADYVPSLHAPGLFENPVDSPIICGVPRLSDGPNEYTAAGLPIAIQKEPESLHLTYDSFPRSHGQEGPTSFPGQRTVHYHIAGDTITITEDWHFETVPTTLSFTLPETPTHQLQVTFTSETPHSTSIVRVRGMPAWRSVWGELARVHQIDFQPGHHIHLTIQITPALKVAHGPSTHDYNRAQYDFTPPDSVQEIPFPSGNCALTTMNVTKLFADADIVHLGWPEHLFSPHGLTESDFDQRYADFLAQLSGSGKKIVWTMHNRRPHQWPSSRGIDLYQRLAGIVDACLHHSHWGQHLMRALYPFRPTCKHFVLPHMHYGRHMRVTQSRALLEQKFNLPPTPIRIGLLGRYQPEKQIEMILNAFINANRDDLQLVCTAYNPTVKLPEHPHIINLPRTDWMTREEIAEHAALCDLLISAHTGDTYLTSGLVADAVGLGLTMLVPEWEFFREIMGDAALYHDNTLAGLTAAIAALNPAQITTAKARSAALWPVYDPTTLAPRLVEILREVRLAPSI